MHSDSRRITRIGTTNVVTASRHSIRRETCKPCDVIKPKWPREEMSPMIVCNNNNNSFINLLKKAFQLNLQFKYLKLSFPKIPLKNAV